jgi:beta-galactosidase
MRMVQPGSAQARNLSNPALWSVEEPHLYTAIVTVSANGAVGDAERVTFGVRSIQFDAQKGFFLNGKSLKIQGTCNHQDHAGVGVALPDRLQYFRLGRAPADGLQRGAHCAQHAHA